MRFVDIEEARAASGLRLVIAGNVPSPWSQAAMGIFDIKGIDYAAVRLRPAAEAIRVWTGSHNAPVAIYDAEPPRTGWAEILALGERLGGRRALIPESDEARVQTFGLAHEILGEGGLGWSVRLLLVHASLTTDGRDGWPSAVASFLAPKYGYAPERAASAHDRAIRVLGLLGRSLETSQRDGNDYFFGHEPTALDIYAATVTNIVATLPPAACPMPEPVRHAFETLDKTVRDAVPSGLIRHRDRMYEHHLQLPMRF
jgi:glutathione S-transferase